MLINRRFPPIFLVLVLLQSALARASSDPDCLIGLDCHAQHGTQIIAKHVGAIVGELPPTIVENNNDSVNQFLSWLDKSYRIVDQKFERFLGADLRGSWGIQRSCNLNHKPAPISIWGGLLVVTWSTQDSAKLLIDVEKTRKITITNSQETYGDIEILNRDKIAITWTSDFIPPIVAALVPNFYDSKPHPHVRSIFERC